MFEKKVLPKKSENFSEWYHRLALEADLAEYAPVRGCVIFKPYGFSIWEEIQRRLDQKIKEFGAKNCYFPLFIPERFLQKEKEHVEGFSPELAVVTIAGGEKLKERLVVRPTSETIMYDAFSRWIKSWRDLPFKINQWANVVRWEKRPRIFLRTTEFLWQEGHCCYATEKESATETLKALRMYESFLKENLSLVGIAGKKSEFEKFPGAKDTFTVEGLMPDKKALQLCTSHDLGQKFSKAFGIKFLDKQGKENYVWQNCWGLSTRVLGALIMTHGDDNGLILPPKVAPVQVVVVPILGKNKTRVLKKAKELKERLKAFRVEVDEREKVSVGFKFNEWELKGVPLRIELGEKELKEKGVTLVRRDTFEKFFVKEKEILGKVTDLLQELQKSLLKKAQKFLKENVREANSFANFQEKIKQGFVLAFWCERESCKIKIKEATQATDRCLPLNAKPKRGRCIFCKKNAKYQWVFAKAY